MHRPSPEPGTQRALSQWLLCVTEGRVWGHLPLSLQVDCLVLQLHRVGEQLEKMNGQRMDELFVLIRDGFLLPAGLSSLAQLLLLEIIEFRAAGWKTTPAAHKYYYSEVSA